MKKVSVIIPCFNQAKYLEDAINSVLNQTYKNIEIILINDASTDNTKEIAKKYLNKVDNFVFIDNKTNLGLSSSRNIGISNSSGEYILPLDADDEIKPTYIEKAVSILDSNEKIGIVYSKAEFFGVISGEWELPAYNLKNFILENCIFCSALYRKKDWLKAGKYDETMKNALEDWDLWLSFIELGFEPYQIPEILFRYRKHSYASMINKNFDKKSVLAYLLKKHIGLYLAHTDLVERIYLDKSYLEQNNKLYLKVKKYKKYCIFLLVLLTSVFVINIFYMY